MSKYKQTELFSKKEMRKIVKDEVEKQSSDVDDTMEKIEYRVVSADEAYVRDITEAVSDMVLDLSERYR